MKQSIQDRIRLTQTKLQIERDPVKKAELQKEMQRLQIRQEIEKLRNRLEQIG
jgi:hypothetical protein